MEQLLLEETYVKVYYDDEFLMGRIIWQDTPKEEEYKKPFQFLLNYGQQHDIENFLSDTRKQGIVSVENRKWFEYEMVEPSKKSGLKRAVVVIDNNPFKKYYMNMILQATNKFGIPMKIFIDAEEGLMWLKNEHIRSKVNAV